jgi:hypothetical protein
MFCFGSYGAGFIFLYQRISELCARCRKGVVGGKIIPFFSSRQNIATALKTMHFTLIGRLERTSFPFEFTHPEKKNFKG